MILLFALGGMALRLTISPDQLMESMSVGTCAVLLSSLDFGNSELLAALPGVMASNPGYFWECYSRVVLTPQAQQHLFDYYFIQRPELHALMLPFEIVDRHAILHGLVRDYLEHWRLPAVRIPISTRNFDNGQLTQLVRTLLDHPERCADHQAWMLASADLGDHWHRGGALELAPSDRTRQLFQAIDQIFATLLTFPYGGISRLAAASDLLDVPSTVEPPLGELLRNCLAHDDASLGAYWAILAELEPTLQQLSPAHNALWRGKLLHLTLYHREAGVGVAQAITEYLGRSPPEALSVLMLGKLSRWAAVTGFFLSDEQTDAVRPAIRRLAILFPRSRLLGGRRGEHLRQWKGYVASRKPRMVQFLPTNVELDDFVSWFGSYQCLSQVLLLPPISKRQSVVITLAPPHEPRKSLHLEDLGELLDVLSERIWARVVGEGLLHKAELQMDQLLCIRALARLLATDLTYRAGLRVELPPELINFFYNDEAEGPPAFHEIRRQLIDYLNLGAFLPLQKWKGDQ